MEFWALITNSTLFFHYDVTLMLHRALFRVFFDISKTTHRRSTLTPHDAEQMISYMRSRGKYALSAP